MYKHRDFFDKNIDNNDSSNNNDWGLFIDVENINEDLNKKNDYVNKKNENVNEYYISYIAIIFLSTYIITYISLVLL